MPAFRLLPIAVFLSLLLGFAHLAAAQPSIKASIAPEPNGYGWSNMPATVEFKCKDAADCPQPIELKREGARNLARGSAQDASGRIATTSVEVNLDFTPAVISILSPQPNLTVDAAAITVTGRVSDELSGVATATCNGEPAPVNVDAVTCVVRLYPGVNDVVLQATDKAGNSSSAGLRVFREGIPSTISVVPATTTILVGREQDLQVVDQFGRTISDAEWAVNDPSVTMSAEPAVHLRALAPGQATATATWHGLSASIQITVMDGERAPNGTRLWTIPALPGFREGNGGFEAFHVVPVDSGSPTLLTVEHEVSGSRLVLRAIDDTVPKQLWLESPPISTRERIGDQLAGDDMGGGLVRVETADGRSSSLVRIGRPVTGGPWRYTPPGRLATGFSDDGGIVHVIETPPDGFPVLVGIDGSTGSAVSRIPLPRGSVVGRNDSCLPGNNVRVDKPSVAGTPSVLGEDRAVHFALGTFEDVYDFLPCGRTSGRLRRAVQLMVVAADGSKWSLRKLHEYEQPAGGSIVINLSTVIPDGTGGVLAPWIVRFENGFVDRRVARVTANTVTEYSLPVLGEMVLGERSGYTSDGHTLVAFDVTTGRVLWTRQAPANGRMAIMTAIGGGGVLLNTEQGPLKLDHDGTIVPD